MPPSSVPQLLPTPPTAMAMNPLIKRISPSEVEASIRGAASSPAAALQAAAAPKLSIVMCSGLMPFSRAPS